MRGLKALRALRRVKEAEGAEGAEGAPPLIWTKSKRTAFCPCEAVPELDR